MPKILAAVVAVMLLPATSAHAQTSMSLGAHVAGGSFAHQSTPNRLEQPDAARFGTGLGVNAGLSFGDRFGLLFGIDHIGLGVRTGHACQRQLDVLGQVSWFGFGTGTAYLTAGLSSSTASTASTRDFPFGRVGPTAGLTGRWPVGAKFTLDVGVLSTYGRFEDAEGNRALFLYRTFPGASYRVGLR